MASRARVDEHRELACGPPLAVGFEELDMGVVPFDRVRVALVLDAEADAVREVDQHLGRTGDEQVRFGPEDGHCIVAAEDAELARPVVGEDVGLDDTTVVRDLRQRGDEPAQIVNRAGEIHGDKRSHTIAQQGGAARRVRGETKG